MARKKRKVREVTPEEAYDFLRVIIEEAQETIKTNAEGVPPDERFEYFRDAVRFLRNENGLLGHLLYPVCRVDLNSALQELHNFTTNGRLVDSGNKQSVRVEQ